MLYAAAVGNYEQYRLGGLGVKGSRVKSRQPDQPMDAIQPGWTGIQPTFLPPSIPPANCAERESDRSIVEPLCTFTRWF
jgi:hypothetical protein